MYPCLSKISDIIAFALFNISFLFFSFLNKLINLAMKIF